MNKRQRKKRDKKQRLLVAYQTTILKNFARKMSNQKPLPREYAELMSKHFWELFM